MGCHAEVERRMGLGGVTSYQIPPNSECGAITKGVRARVLRSWSERERTQTNRQGPQIAAKLNKGSPPAQTARMFAWKQQFI